MPRALVAALDLPWLGRQQGLLADGSAHIFDVYSTSILWDSELRAVETEAVDAEPLIGMGLLQGSELRIHVVKNGRVSVETAP